MSYNIRVGSSSYQLIFEDNDVIITGKFFWDTNNVNIKKGHFNLVNKATHGDNFKIHNVLYCSNYKMLELRLSSHSDFDVSNLIKNQPLNGLKLGVGDSQEYWFRVSPQSLACDRPVCADPTVAGSPDDKDGSILIGTQ